MTIEFNYVIARLWNNGESNLCTYAYGREVFYGTLEDARSMRNFIRERAEENSNEYQIYKVSSTPIE